jgi:type IX secretion system substrate protein
MIMKSLLCKQFSIAFLAIILSINFANAQPTIDSVSLVSDTHFQYEKLEVNCYVKTQIVDIFDYEKFNLFAIFSGPNGLVDTVDAFYFQDFTMTEPDVLVQKGDPFWKLRYTPELAGEWTFRLLCIDSTGQAEFPEIDFSCQEKNDPGFVRTVEGYNVYFDNNKVFRPIGQNMAWDGFVGDFFDYQNWTDSMTYYGADLCRVYMAPWSFALEWGQNSIGEYKARQNKAWQMDWLFDELQQKDIYVLLVLQSHAALNYDNGTGYQWSDNPYNIANGGPCVQPYDFFTNGQAKDFFQRKLRYIQSRWGYSKNILMWELISEADNFSYYDENKTSIRNWIVEMADYLKTRDVNHHFTSASYAIPENDSLLWLNPAIDIAHVHVYQPSDGDLTLSLYDRISDYYEAFQKPVIASESGLHHIKDSVVVQDPRGLTFHNSLWVTPMAGSFSSALPWHWRLYIDGLDLYPEYWGINEFLKDDAFYQGQSSPVQVICASEEKLDIIVTPRFFSLTQKTPEDIFNVQPTGRVSPPHNFLGEVLYGTDPIGQGLRNPPTFIIDYQDDGQIEVHTGSFVNSGVLKVIMDEEVLLETQAGAMEIYSVNIVAGAHNIRVENAGTAFGSYIEIEHYVFKNAASALRGFAVQNSTGLRVWLQNRLYSWQHWLNQGTEPPAIENVSFELNDLANGQYQVEWWNTNSGQVDSMETIYVSGQKHSFEISSLLWDVALKMDKVVGFEDESFDGNSKISVFPNPFKNQLQVKIPDCFEGVLNFIVRDVNGRVCLSKDGLHTEKGALIEIATNSLAPGFYILSIDDGQQKKNFKLVKAIK